MSSNSSGPDWRRLNDRLRSVLICCSPKALSCQHRSKSDGSERHISPKAKNKKKIGNRRSIYTKVHSYPRRGDCQTLLHITFLRKLGQKDCCI